MRSTTQSRKLMNYRELGPFLESNHDAVLTTFRANGAAQMSTVTVGSLKNSAAFNTTEQRAKLRNLKRYHHCSLLISTPNWREYVVLEGTARLYTMENTKAEELSFTLREIYRSATGNEHPDWDDYDIAMRTDRRVTVVISPDKVYGTIE